MKKNFLGLMIVTQLLIFSPSAVAIRPNIVKVVTALTGTASFGLTWKLRKKYFQKRSFFYAPFVSSITSLITYYLLYQLTPEGRMYCSELQLKQLEKYDLVTHNFDQKEDFFRLLHDIYINQDLPLISAYNTLTILLPAIQSIISLIEKAQGEIYRDYDLADRCEVIFAQAQYYKHNISTGIKWIREHKDYLEQLKIYKEFLAEDDQNKINKQIVDTHHQLAQTSRSFSIADWFNGWL